MTDRRARRSEGVRRTADALTSAFPLRLARQLRARARRLLRSVSPHTARPDDAWAAARLTSAERGVYLAMDPRDREHAVRVARHLASAHPDAPGELIAAALLHDCGKSVRPYHVVERVLVGLVPLRLAEAAPAGALHVRAHHPEIGARLIRDAGGRTRVAQLVAWHHTPHRDTGAALLHRYDDLE